VVSVNWVPAQLTAGKDIVVDLKFLGSNDSQNAGRTISATIHYGLNLIDLSGHIVISKSNLTAFNGQSNVTLNFASNGSYWVQAKITSIDYPGSQSTSDMRQDVARGVVIVPEFKPTTLALVLPIAVIAILTRRSFWKR
jgi:hypothetical protein